MYVVLLPNNLFDSDHKSIKPSDDAEGSSYTDRKHPMHGK